MASILQSKKSSKIDINTPEGLRVLADLTNTPVPQEKRRRAGLLGGLSKFLDFIRTGEFAVGGLLSGKGVRKGIKEKISPSDVLFGEAPKNQKFFTPGNLGRIVVDGLLDPTTYLTLGTGSALKVVTKAGTKVALSKTGKQMVSDLADDIMKNAVKQTGVATSRRVAVDEAKEVVGNLATQQIAQSTFERGGLRNITRGLQATGVKATRENVERAVKEGVSGLRAKSGLKFAGVRLVPAATLKAPIKKPTDLVIKQLNKTETGKELVDGLKKTGGAIASLFNRDFGLPKQFVRIKQNFLDGYDNAAGRIKDDINVIFAGTTKSEREAITVALEKGKRGIRDLDPKLQPIAFRVREIFERVAVEEESKGLLNTTMENYVAHIYRDTDKAKSLIGEINKGKESALLRFAKSRSIHSLAVAEELGLNPIKDVAEILNIRLLASEKAKLTQSFFRRVVNNFGEQPLTNIVTKSFNKEDIARADTAINSLSKSISDHIAKPLKKLTSDGKKIRRGSLLRGFPFETVPEAQKALDDLLELEDLMKKIKEADTADRIKLAEKIDAKIGGSQNSLGLAFESQVLRQVKSQDPKLFKEMMESRFSLVRMGDVGVGVPKTIADAQIPEIIGKDIVKMGKKFFDDDSAMSLLRFYDHSLNFFKGSVTVLFPAFHGRNAVSNVMQNFLDIGVQAFNPVVHKKATAILKGADGVLVTDLGERITYKEIRKQINRTQVFQNKLRRTDVSKILTSNPIKKKIPLK